MLGETANLDVLDGESVAYLDIAESPQSKHWEARTGGRDGIHSTAQGKQSRRTYRERAYGTFSP